MSVSTGTKAPARSDGRFPATANRVLIAVNPRAGSRGGAPRIARITESLAHDGFQVDVLTDLAEVVAEAQRLHEQGQLRALVAAGGDGTVAEIVNRTEPGLPVAVYPMGTANLLAGYLEMPASPEAFAGVIATGSIIRLDAGLANGRIFLLMAGCGFDADVVQRLHGQRRGHISTWSYAKPILEAIRGYRFPELRIHICTPQEAADDAALSNAISSDWAAEPVTARWAFAVNLPPYGGGLRLAPSAVGTDGLLNVCALARGSFWHGLRYWVHIMLGRHEGLPDCTTALARRIRIESDQAVPYQLDGDPGGMLPLEIEVLPQRLTLLAPAGRFSRRA